MVSFPLVFSPRPYTSHSPHPYAPHAQPMSFFSILSPAQYWARSTNHLVPRYAVASTPPLPRPSTVRCSIRAWKMYKLSTRKSILTPVGFWWQFLSCMFAIVWVLFFSECVNTALCCYEEKFTFLLNFAALSFFLSLSPWLRYEVQQRHYSLQDN